MTRTRVVVTGADVVSPLGTTWPTTCDALKDGRTGIRPLTLVDSREFPLIAAGEVPSLPGEATGATRIQRMLDKTAAAALQRSGVDVRRARVGVSVGVGRQPGANLARLGSSEERGDEVQRAYEGQAARLSQMLPMPGPAYCCYTACASGNDAVGFGLRALRRGDADVMLCGAADSQIGPLPLLEFSLLNVITGSALPQPRPFDRTRDGFVVGEGAAVVVLETLERALERRAPILGEVLGYGSASDAYSLTRGQPDGAGAARAMTHALADADVTARDIDYVNAHGTATAVGDRLEARAMKAVFGEHLARVPVSSTKAMTGHLLAACAAVELAFCLMALADQFVPPTINHVEPDPDCDFDCVPNTSRSARLDVIMSNAFGFGGQNSSLVVARYVV